MQAKVMATDLLSSNNLAAMLVKGCFVTVIASVSQRLPWRPPWRQRRQCRRPGKQSFENQEIASAKSASQ
jgi:hypothetical protein